MRVREGVLFAAAVLAAAGCRSWDREDLSRDAEKTFQEAEGRVRESRTLSGLAKLEESLAAFTKTENRIPGRLEDLIPKYLAELPGVELGVRGHKDNTSVQAYTSDILRDGRVDGTRLKDTGRWGYVYTTNRVVVFVDCTHMTSRGAPWYQQRGVY